MIVTMRRMWWKTLALGSFAVGVLVSCRYLDSDANYIAEDLVWKKIKEEAPLHGLNPHFVYAICHAESSLDANAESSVARGMMQLTEAAWTDVTDLHYRQAFDWRTNVEVGMLYLKRLQEILDRNEVFTYPRLAASYRYGYGALRKEKYMVSRLKPPLNRIYRKLFAGETAPVRTPS
ncbi:MAG: transglycosylase SLT domain-containing protein [Verrucomicrobiota bacterium]|nr:transglycosylase SLT domain-containing protein [Verrucomicrobiota bacterium]